MALITLQRVKDRLGIADTTRDDFLTAQIEYYSQLIETYCERIFAAADYTFTWDAPLDTGGVFNDRRIYIEQYPINSITSITVNATAVTEYQVDVSSIYAPEFLSATSIEIQYNGGFVTIPEPVAMACEELVVSKYYNIGSDPTKVVRAESVPEVGSVDYVASTYQRGMDPVLGIYTIQLDSYRTERHFELDASP